MEAIKQIITEQGLIAIDLTKFVNKLEDLQKLCKTLDLSKDPKKVYIVNSSHVVMSYLKILCRETRNMNLQFFDESIQLFMLFRLDDFFYAPINHKTIKQSIVKFLNEDSGKHCNICFSDDCGDKHICNECCFEQCYDCLKKFNYICAVCKTLQIFT